MPAGTPLRVLLLNVHTSSTTYEQVRRLIADERPDVVALLEVDGRWLGEFEPALVGYPEQIEHPRTDNFGLALYARRPLRGEVESLGSELPTLVAHLTLQRTQLAMVLTHPIPPVGQEPDERNATQLAAVGRRAHALGSRVVLLGDFNATPWSTPFLRLRNATGLAIRAPGSGCRPRFQQARRSCAFRSITSSCRARSGCAIDASDVMSARITCRSSSISSCPSGARVRSTKRRSSTMPATLS